MLTFLGVLARGANFTNVHLSRLVAGVQKAGFDIPDISLASGSAEMFSAMRCLRPARIGLERAKRRSRIRSVARTVSSRHRMSVRAMELVSGHESLLALSSRGLSLNPLCKLQARAGDLLGIRGTTVNRAQGTESIWWNLMSSPW